MKRLIFIRHARAEDYNPDMPDFERSLTSKGKDVSRKMASLLKSKIDKPGAFISSPAFRAIETAMIFASEYGIKPEQIILSSGLYFTFGEKALMELLAGISEDTDTVMLFGHNPGFTDLAGFLSSEAVDVIPKCGIVSITFNTKTWSDIRPATGKTEMFLKPKKLL
jgi:phosphohistidine phosphatase